MPDTDSDNSQPRRVRFDGTITAGNVIQVLLVLGSVVIWQAQKNNAAEQAAKDVIGIQTDLTAKMVELRAAIASGLGDVQKQIAILPDQRAALEQLTRRLADVETRYDSLTKHMGEVERAVIETRADLNTILRQANVPLPRGRQ
jgi:chromosome segregation ATPase